MKKRRWHKPNAKSKNKNSKLNFAFCSLNFKLALVLTLVVMLAVALLPQPVYAAAPTVQSVTGQTADAVNQVVLNNNRAWVMCGLLRGWSTKE